MSVPETGERLVAARETYARWLRSAHTGAHSRRTAERNAAFFLPHLKRGMSLLDGGCGPGSITLGLARAVSPGRAVGVDVDSSVLEKARQLASSQGVENVSFEQHHLRALPYADATFDAVFAHAVLQHVDDAARVVAELFRVLKPGGVIGLADADFGGAIFYPDDPLLDRSTEILVAIRIEGNPRVGRQLRSLLLSTGFERVWATAVPGAEAESAITAYNGNFWAERFSAEPFVAYAEALGISTREELTGISAAWRAWGQHPGAFAARFWCQAVGFKPS